MGCTTTDGGLIMHIAHHQKLVEIYAYSMLHVASPEYRCTEKSNTEKEENKTKNNKTKRKQSNKQKENKRKLI